MFHKAILCKNNVHSIIFFIIDKLVQDYPIIIDKNDIGTLYTYNFI